MYVYVCLHMFCNRFIFLLCALGTPWANYSAAFPKRVRQCHNIPGSGRNTVKTLVYYNYTL